PAHPSAAPGRAGPGRGRGGGGGPGGGAPAPAKPLPPPLKGKTPVSRAVLSDDGRRLVTVGRAEGPYRSAKSEVQVWDVATAKAVSRPLHSDPDHLIVLLSPDGSRLFLGQKTWDKTRRLTPGLSPKEWQQ